MQINIELAAPPRASWKEKKKKRQLLSPCPCQKACFTSHEAPSFLFSCIIPAAEIQERRENGGGDKGRVIDALTGPQRVRLEFFVLTDLEA